MTAGRALAVRPLSGLRRITAALCVALGTTVAAEPAFVFVGDGWKMAVGEPEVYAFQSFSPTTGGIGLLVTLTEPAAEALAAHTAAHLDEAMTLRDGDGGVLVETTLAEPIRRRFAVSFGDPAAAQRAARRMLGQE